MAGAILLIFVMVAVMPPGLFLTGMIIAGLIGEPATTDAEQRYEGTDYLNMI